MDHFAGLDVSVKETSVCIVDDAGRIVREVRVASEPEALLAVLKSPAYRFRRIGLEAGPLSQWLFSALAEAGLPVICVETRHMRAVLKAQINKTDRNDARGMAPMMRVGLLPPGSCEDITQSETADAADPPQAAAVEGDRCRERPARHVAQLRSQRRNNREGEVRSADQGACREPSRPGGAG
jgi:transposase